jgi:hypothetical protein
MSYVPEKEFLVIVDVVVVVIVVVVIVETEAGEAKKLKVLCTSAF